MSGFIYGQDTRFAERNSISSPNVEFKFKLVLLGDASVGKSCLVVRFVKNEFYERQEPTIGAAFTTRRINLGDCVVKFEIWDTAGQERYRSLAPMYYRGAAAAVIVYDITDEESYKGAQSWIAELQAIRSGDIVIALAGNKSDLDDRAVDAEDARSYAARNNLIFLETSAKTGKNVNQIFQEIAYRLPKNKEQFDSNSGFQIGTKVSPDNQKSRCGC